MSWSSLTPAASTSSSPTWSNPNATAPGLARFPPCFSKSLRISAAARFTLSVRQSTMTATPAVP